MKRAAQFTGYGRKYPSLKLLKRNHFQHISHPVKINRNQMNLPEITKSKDKEAKLKFNGIKT